MTASETVKISKGQEVRRSNIAIKIDWILSEKRKMVCSLFLFSSVDDDEFRELMIRPI